MLQIPNAHSALSENWICQVVSDLARVFAQGMHSTVREVMSNCVLSIAYPVLKSKVEELSGEKDNTISG